MFLLLLLLLYNGLKVVFSQYKVILRPAVWTAGNGAPLSHSGYLAYGNNQEETRVRSRHNNNSKRVIKNLEERNVGTKR